MADIVTTEVRSRMMSGIRSKDTQPELVIRKALHAAGFRYRLHDKRLPGKPDLLFPKYKAVIFVHGCFWHGHDCHPFRLPSTRTEFWQAKIARNQKRDQEVHRSLQDNDWHVLVIWECALKGRTKLAFSELIGRISAWIISSSSTTEIEGEPS